MSFIDIDSLNKTAKNKKIKRLKLFDDILKKIHSRIIYQSNLEKTYCFYQIPEFIIGVPLYDVKKLTDYLIKSLKLNGFGILHIDPNWLFISWDEDLKKIKKNKKKKTSEYKSIEEYKPSGGFIYSDLDLSSIKEKTERYS